VLGRKALRALIPLAAEWLLRGISAEGLRAALTLGLPGAMRSVKGVLRWRLAEKMPAAPPIGTAEAAPVPQPARSLAE